MKARLRRIIPYLFVVVALAGAAWAVGKNRHELAVVLSRLGAGSIALSFVFGILGVLCTYLTWRELLHGLGARVPWLPAAQVFFVSQLGKYIPGSIWPVMAQMEYGRRTATGRRTMLTANAILLALSLAAGLIVAAICVPFAAPDALHRYAWVFAFLPVLALALHPRVIPAALNWLFKRIGRQPVEQYVPWPQTLRALGWAFASWILLGLHLLILLRGVGVTDWHGLPASIGGFALAVVAGVLFVPAPAGAGIRDAVLVATLATLTDAATALAVGLASRVLLIAVDLAVAGAGTVAARRVRSAPEVQR